MIGKQNKVDKYCDKTEWEYGIWKAVKAKSG